MRSAGNSGRQVVEPRLPETSSPAGVPLIVSTRTSEANRSERRGARRGPVTVSPETSSQRLTWAAEM